MATEGKYGLVMPVGIVSEPNQPVENDYGLTMPVGIEEKEEPASVPTATATVEPTAVPVEPVEPVVIPPTGLALPTGYEPTTKEQIYSSLPAPKQGPQTAAFEKVLRQVSFTDQLKKQKWFTSSPERPSDIGTDVNMKILATSIDFNKDAKYFRDRGWSELEINAGLSKIKTENEYKFFRLQQETEMLERWREAAKTAKLELTGIEGEDIHLQAWNREATKDFNSAQEKYEDVTNRRIEAGLPEHLTYTEGIELLEKGCLKSLIIWDDKYEEAAKARRHQLLSFGMTGHKFSLEDVPPEGIEHPRFDQYLLSSSENVSTVAAVLDSPVLRNIIDSFAVMHAMIKEGVDPLTFMSTETDTSRLRDDYFNALRKAVQHKLLVESIYDKDNSEAALNAGHLLGFGIDAYAASLMATGLVGKAASPLKHGAAWGASHEFMHNHPIDKNESFSHYLARNSANTAIHIASAAFMEAITVAVANKALRGLQRILNGPPQTIDDLLKELGKDYTVTVGDVKLLREPDRLIAALAKMDDAVGGVAQDAIVISATKSTGELGPKVLSKLKTIKGFAAAPAGPASSTVSALPQTQHRVGGEIVTHSQKVPIHSATTPVPKYPGGATTPPSALAGTRMGRLLETGKLPGRTPTTEKPNVGKLRGTPGAVYLQNTTIDKLLKGDPEQAAVGIGSPHVEPGAMGVILKNQMARNGMGKYQLHLARSPKTNAQIDRLIGNEVTSLEITDETIYQWAMGKHSITDPFGGVIKKLLQRSEGGMLAAQDMTSAFTYRNAKLGPIFQKYKTTKGHLPKHLRNDPKLWKAMGMTEEELLEGIKKGTVDPALVRFKREFWSPLTQEMHQDILKVGTPPGYKYQPEYVPRKYKPEIMAQLRHGRGPAFEKLMKLNNIPPDQREVIIGHFNNYNMPGVTPFNPRILKQVPDEFLVTNLDTILLDHTNAVYSRLGLLSDEGAGWAAQMKLKDISPWSVSKGDLPIQTYINMAKSYGKSHGAIVNNAFDRFMGTYTPVRLTHPSLTKLESIFRVTEIGLKLPYITLQNVSQTMQTDLPTWGAINYVKGVARAATKAGRAEAFSSGAVLRGVAQDVIDLGALHEGPYHLARWMLKANLHTYTEVMNQVISANIGKVALESMAKQLKRNAAFALKHGRLAQITNGAMKIPVGKSTSQMTELLHEVGFTDKMITKLAATGKPTSAMINRMMQQNVVNNHFVNDVLNRMGWVADVKWAGQFRTFPVAMMNKAQSFTARTIPHPIRNDMGQILWNKWAGGDLRPILGYATGLGAMDVARSWRLALSGRNINDETTMERIANDIAYVGSTGLLDQAFSVSKYEHGLGVVAGLLGPQASDVYEWSLAAAGQEKYSALGGLWEPKGRTPEALLAKARLVASQISPLAQDILAAQSNKDYDYAKKKLYARLSKEKRLAGLFEPDISGLSSDASYHIGQYMHHMAMDMPESAVVGGGVEKWLREKKRQVIGGALSPLGGDYQPGENPEMAYYSLTEAILARMQQKNVSFYTAIGNEKDGSGIIGSILGPDIWDKLQKEFALDSSMRPQDFQRYLEDKFSPEDITMLKAYKELRLGAQRNAMQMIGTVENLIKDQAGASGFSFDPSKTYRDGEANTLRKIMRGIGHENFSGRN